VSKYVAVPAYQTSSVPGMGNQTLRNVADVAFNADPSTGQYVAIMAPGSSAVQWYSVGGTSLATPQWAGVVAVTNAMRAQNGQGPLGLVQNFVYKAAISTANFFTSIFTDITNGSNGGFGARAYYDQPTGLGSPNTSNFIALAAGGAAQPQPAGTSPTVSPITINGVAGTALSFSMAFTSPDPVNWALTGAPAGMTVDASGMIAWATPVAGTYQVALMATDPVTQLSGSATATIVISVPATPMVTSATVLGQAGRALTHQVNVQSNNPVAWTLAGNVPAGVTISSNGVLSWSNPVAGNYSVTVKASDATTSAVGSGVITLQISSAAATGPVITAPALTGTAGRALSGVVTISDPTARFISISIAGAPAGMGFGVSGQDLLLSWARPVVGTYNLRITATNNNQVSAQATMTIQIK
jgi:hypothetical protein